MNCDYCTRRIIGRVFHYDRIQMHVSEEPLVTAEQVARFMDHNRKNICSDCIKDMGIKIH